ncbi:hypothetical protein BH11PSE9_BH11PSE9_27240 [soil metagenome]
MHEVCITPFKEPPMNIRPFIAAALLAAGASNSFALTTYTFGASFTYTAPGAVTLGFGRADTRSIVPDPNGLTQFSAKGGIGSQLSTLSDPGYTPGTLPFNYLDVWNFNGLTAGTYNVATSIQATGSLAIGTALLSWYSGGMLHSEALSVAPSFASASGITSITVDSNCGASSCVFVQLLGWEDKTDTTRGYNATITSVPEPETYAMLLAGLGVIGFVARRRTPAPVSSRGALKVL